jgi:hypothetical protein
VDWTAPTVASFVTQVSIALQPSAAGGLVGPCFQVSGGTGLRLESNTCVHGGNCSALSWPHNTALYASLLTGAAVVNNSFFCHCQGYSFDSSGFLYVVGNRWESLGNDSEGSGMSTFATGVIELMYFGNNTDIGNPQATKRWESFTFDGPNGVYVGLLANVSEDGLTLALAAPTHGSPYLRANLGVTVVAGDGLGAVGRAATYTTNTIVLQQPLPISPTVTGPLGHGPAAAGAASVASLLAVAPFRGWAAFEGNRFVNGTTFQFYGAGTHIYTSGNRFENFGNVGSWGLFYQGGLQPCLFNQFLGNVLQSGGDLHAFGQPVGPGVLPFNYTSSLGFAQVFRGNRLCGHSGMYMEGALDNVLVEDNLFFNTSAAIRADPTVLNLWLNRNANAGDSALCEV